MTESKVNSRELIVTMLLSINNGEEYSHILIKNVLDKYDYLEGKEKAFIKNVTEGSMERRIELDYIIDSFSKTPVKKMKPFIRELLRMSVYQLMFLDKVPASAVINEAVKLAKKKGFTGLSGFVNGVLRGIERGKNDIKYPSKDKEPLKARSIEYSMPEWIIEDLDSYIGEEKTDNVLSAFLLPRPVVIRFSNALSLDEIKKHVMAMEEAGAKVSKQAYGDRIYTLTHAGSIAKLSGFSDGAFAIQDVSSQIAVQASGIKEGDTVIDVCAAPGGKSVFAAELAGEKGKVIARDLTAYKTSLINENVSRMKLGNVSVEEWDATVLDESKIGTADVVIADLPCMGFGVIGRKRDIKYKVTKEQLDEVAALQKNILDVVSKYVKPGGVLMFSTCSISAKENKENADYIESNLGFMGEDITPFINEELLKDIKANGGLDDLKRGRLQLLPGIFDSDGFFLTRWKKQI